MSRRFLYNNHRNMEKPVLPFLEIDKRIESVIKSDSRGRTATRQINNKNYYFYNGNWIEYNDPYLYKYKTPIKTICQYYTENKWIDAIYSGSEYIVPKNDSVRLIRFYFPTKNNMYRGIVKNENIEPKKNPNGCCDSFNVGWNNTGEWSFIEEKIY